MESPPEKYMESPPEKYMESPTEKYMESPPEKTWKIHQKNTLSKGWVLINSQEIIDIGDFTT